MYITYRGKWKPLGPLAGIVETRPWQAKGQAPFDSAASRFFPLPIEWTGGNQTFCASHKMWSKPKKSLKRHELVGLNAQSD